MKHTCLMTLIMNHGVTVIFSHPNLNPVRFLLCFIWEIRQFLRHKCYDDFFEFSNVILLKVTAILMLYSVSNQKANFMLTLFIYHFKSLFLPVEQSIYELFSVVCNIYDLSPFYLTEFIMIINMAVCTHTHITHAQEHVSV